MSLNWGALEAAVKAAVVAASGLAASLVRWEYQAYQGQARPVGNPHLTLRFGPLASLGIDGTISTTDLTRPRGEEVEIATISPREVTLTIQAFGGTPAGDQSALAALTRVRERLALPSVRAHFLDVGLAPFAPGTVRYLPAIEGTKFEGRALLEIRCYVDASESEYVGFIETTEVTGTYLTEVGSFIGTFTITTGA